MAAAALHRTATAQEACGGLRAEQGGHYYYVASNPIAEVASSPASALLKLRLQFEARARGVTCVSQALGGVVTAAIVVLADCSARQDGHAMRQFLSIGLLVHSRTRLR